MKKVLCGLVIALMMTGSGYADLDRDQCKYLKDQSEILVFQGYIKRQAIHREVEKQAKERFNPSVWEPLLKDELSIIKRAHHFAVTWSVLCD